MKKLIRVGNTGEGHLSLVFDKDYSNRDCIANFDQGMISVFGDESGRDIVEIEVLFVEEPGRIDNLMRVVSLYDLDLSPLFSTYEGTLCEMTIAQCREKYKDISN